MHFPQLKLRQKKYGGEEIFFDADQELMRVLAQDNPVYLVLDLPGLVTKVVICFPAQTITRVYAVEGRRQYFIGESSEAEHPIWTAPAEVDYRYGMELVPWMFLGDLNCDTPIEHDHIVNYIVLNCCVGHKGVNVRLFRSHGGREKDWLEIHQFSTGNEYRFAEEWRKQSRIITRFVPNEIQSSSMTWKPEGGWARYQTQYIPCKI